MKTNLCWLRRDLRTEDNHALSRSLNNGPTYVVFIFDVHILKKLKDPYDRRITFIMESLYEMEAALKKFGSSLIVRYGDPTEEIVHLCRELKIEGLYFNRDYEPYAKKRDEKVRRAVSLLSIEVFDFKDHVFYEKNEVLKDDGKIYHVFTPYQKKWTTKLKQAEEIVPSYKCHLRSLASLKNSESVDKKDWYSAIHFFPTQNILKGGRSEGLKKLKKFAQSIKDYARDRDLINKKTTSNLSPYLRMGNISIREMLQMALLHQNVEGGKKWLSEIIWREFYQMILDSCPYVESHSLKKEIDHLKWPGKKKHFELWCLGLTGYPLIDAAMRCLNETGQMHNRLRMVVANFLCKVLLINWKWGEHYFAAKLLDYDLAANNGGWQWSASTGVDPQPYFRIFNPYLQSRKYDPHGQFIRKWCPELRGFDDSSIHAPHETEWDEQTRAQCFIGQEYPAPIVIYNEQIKKAKLMYQSLK